jgi:hypothetical protein
VDSFKLVQKIPVHSIDCEMKKRMAGRYDRRQDSGQVGKDDCGHTFTQRRMVAGEWRGWLFEFVEEGKRATSKLVRYRPVPWIHG